MTQVSLLAGIYADGAPNVRRAMPRNLVPVPKSNGASEGYLRPGDGLTMYAQGPGIDRGGVVWKERHYRAMGSRLVRLDGQGLAVDMGSIGPGWYCRFAYSTEHLAIASGGRLFLFDGSTVAQVTDGDIGAVLAVEWVDGYFVMTDGEYMPVTDLVDPFSVNPLRYGSSEADSDPIVGLIKLRNELHAINRYSTEVFQNIGGNGFPLQRVPSAYVQCGAVGPHAACLYSDFIAIVGGARNESTGVWLVANGSRSKVSDSEVESLLEACTPEQLSGVYLEQRAYRAHEHLLLHLPDRCLVFDGKASKELKRLTWFQLDSGTTSPTTYRARGLVAHAGKWYAGDPTSDAVCELTDANGMHYGKMVQHEFSTPMLYLEGNDGIIHEMELVAMPGSV